MRGYGSIQCGYWTHPDIRAAAREVREARELGAYLFTGPHSNGIGCYWLPDGYVMADLEYSFETVSKAFAELFRTGLVDRCPNSGYLLLHKYLKYNPIANPNVSKARRQEFDTIPKTFMYFSQLAAYLLEFGGHWDDGFKAHLETLTETVPQTVPQTVTRTSSKQDPIRSYPKHPELPSSHGPDSRAHTRARGPVGNGASGPPSSLDPAQREVAERMQAELEQRRAALGLESGTGPRLVGEIGAAVADDEPGKSNSETRKTRFDGDGE